MIKVIFASAVIWLSASAHAQQSMDTVPKLRLTNRSLNINREGDTRTSEITVEDQSGKSYRLKKVNSDVKEFFVNGQKVSDADMPKYKNVLDQMSWMEQRSVEMGARKRLEAIRMRGQGLQRQRLLEGRRKQLVQERQRGVQNRIRENQSRLNRIRPQERRSLLLQRGMNLQNQIRLQPNSRRGISMLRPQALYGPPMNEFNAIIGELRREDLVSNPDDLTFSLDNKELVVNGKKQPAELHNKLKQRFIRKDGDVIKYSKKGNTTSTTLNRN